MSDDGGYILHYNGSKWSVASKRFSGFGELTGVTAFSASNVWVFGGPGASPGFGTWRYNGSSWREDRTATRLGIVLASPLSRSNMWALGSVTVGEDAIFHYTGSWRRATASALSGLGFQDVLAVGSANVWATVAAQGTGFKSFLVHRTDRGWSRIRVPWAVSLGALATDGRGGLFVTAQDPSGRWWALHRSRTRQWTRTLLARAGGVFGLARIPATTSLWATGTVSTTTGANAVIWAHGCIG